MRGPGAACRWWSVGSVSLLAAAALALAIAWPSLFDSLLASQLELRPDSRSFREWLEPSIPIYFTVYVFNWTNSHAFPQEMPHVEELGPYTFREIRRHVNVTWHPQNASLSYRTFRSWHFEPGRSNGSLDDPVTMVNVVAASAAYRARDWGFIRQSSVSMGLNLYNQKIAVHKRVNELLFEGYPDEMLEMARNLPKTMTGGAPPIDRFGWFYGRNNTVDTEGQMEVTTGALKDTLPGQILKWNYEDNLVHYSGHCAKLEGSAGEFMPRNLTPESELAMFVADLCRPLRLQYSGSGEMQGLSYHRYEVNSRTFDNSSDFHENTCFCHGACAWAGTMNVSACRFGAPAFVSLPHFLRAPAPRRRVAGLRPDPAKHAFYFAVEPKLGVPLDVAARFQLNILIQPSQNIALYEGIPEVLFPVLWVEQHVLPSPSIFQELRMVRKALDWGGAGLACLALLLGAVVTAVTCTNVCRRKPHQYTPTPDIARSEKPKDEAEMKLYPK